MATTNSTGKTHQNPRPASRVKVREKAESVQPRQHEPAIEALIATTQELLQMNRKLGDGDAIQPWDREALHKRVEAAIAAVRAPVASTSKLCTVDDGRQLAARMLREIEAICNDHTHDPYCVMAYDAYNDVGELCIYRTGPQHNVVLEYVKQADGNEEALRGFGQVLTDHLAAPFEGVVPGSPQGRVPPPRELSDRAAAVLKRKRSNRDDAEGASA